MDSTVEQKNMDNISLKDLNATLLELQEDIQGFRQQRIAITKNDVAQWMNSWATDDDALLMPLVAINDGSPIQGFPETVGELLKLDETVVRCLRALRGVSASNDMSTLDSAREARDVSPSDIANRRMLAIAIGLDQAVISKRLKSGA